MKRICLLWILFVFLLMSGCEEDIETPELLNYDIEVENFESFFNLAYRIDSREEHIIDLDITTKQAYPMIDVDVKISIYYGYIYDQMYIQDIYNIDMNLTEAHHEFQKTLALGINHQITDIVVQEASGYIKYHEDISIDTKSYEIPYEMTHLGIEDMQQNLLVYDELKSKLDEVNEKMSQSYEAVTTVVQTITMEDMTFDIESVSTITAIKEPFYFRMADEYSDTIITELNGRYFMYQWDGMNYNNKKMMSYDLLSDADLDFYKLMAFDQSEEMIEEPTRLKFNKIRDSYMISGYIKDMMDIDLIEMFLDFGVDGNSIANTLITIKFSFTATSMHVETAFPMALASEGIQIDTLLTETYVFEDVEMIDIRLDEDYYLMYPGDIYAVTEETEFLDKFYQDEPGLAHAYKGYIEKGFYEFDDFGSNYNVFFYDEDGLIIPGPTSNIYLNSNVFEIKEDGYYYIKIIRMSYQYNETYAFQLNDTGLNDYMTTPIDIEEGVTTTLHVESVKDIVKIVFDVEQTSIIKFNFDISSGITIYADYVNNQMTSSYVTDTYEYGAKTGKHALYIKSSTEVTGTFTYEKVVVPDVYSSNTNGMLTASTSFFEEDFYYGGHLGRAYIKLEVPSPMNYKFYLKTGNASLYVVQGSSLYSVHSFYNGGEAFLTTNTYVIIFNSNQTIRNNVYYESYVYEATATDLTLNHFEYGPNLLNTIDEYLTMILTKGQYKVYEFTLVNDSDILYYAANTLLKNEAGEILNLHDEEFNEGYHNNDVYHLKAGTYQIIQDSPIVDRSMTYTMKIGIIDNLPEDDNGMIDPYVMTNQGSVTLTRDHLYDNELIKLVITEAGSYHFTSTRSFNFISEGDASGSYTNNISYNLEVGTYYIYYDAAWYQDESFTVTVS